MVRTTDIAEKTKRAIRRKIYHRFGHDVDDDEDYLDFELGQVFIRKIPSNFKLLFAFAGEHCSCHHQRLTAAVILQHSNINLETWFEYLTRQQSLDSRTVKGIRRTQFRMIDRAVGLIQDRILIESAPDAPDAVYSDTDTEHE